MASFFEKLKKGMSIKEPSEEMEENIKKIPEKKRAKVKAEKTKSDVLADAQKDKKAKKEEKKPDKVQIPTQQITGADQKQGKEKFKNIDIKTMPVETKIIPEALPPTFEKIPAFAPVSSAIEDDKKNVNTPAPTLLTPDFSSENSADKSTGKLTEKPVYAENTVNKEKWFEQEGELAVDVYQTENNLIIQSAIAGINPKDLDIIMEKDIITIKGFRKKPQEEEGDYFTKECFWGGFKREIILPVEVDPSLAEATMKEGILTIKIPKILREKKRIIKIKL